MVSTKYKFNIIVPSRYDYMRDKCWSIRQFLLNNLWKVKPSLTFGDETDIL